ncbi:MAG: porin [Candidatus Methylumidiphilus sp.]
MKKHKLLLIAATVGGLLGGHAQVAEAAKKPSKDAQIEALVRRLEVLEQRLALDEGKEPGKKLAAKTTAAQVAEADQPAIKQLDQKVKILERKLELDHEVAADAAKKASKEDMSPEGLRLTSPEGDHTIRLHAALQADAKFFMDDNAATTITPTAGSSSYPSTLPGGLPNGINLADTFQLKQARIGVQGTLFKYFDFNVLPDWGKGATLLQYAYLDARYLPYASLSIGKQKTPLSLERIQGDSDGTFLERGYPTQLASNRDVGIMLHGSFAKPGEKLITGGINPLDSRNFFNYQLGVFNGSGDNGTASNMNDTANQDGKDFIGRIFAHPFQKSGIKPLEGLGVGVAGSYSSLNQSTTVLNNLVSANGQNTIVNYSLPGANAAFLSADGSHYRVYPQLYWYYGPFGLMGEYALSSQRLQATKAGANPQTRHITENNQAWQVWASYVLTGEDVTFQGVRPRQPFDPFNGNWGALQFTARYTELDIDNSVYENQGINNTAANRFVFLDPSKSITQATGWALGINWYLNRNVLVRSDYEQTYFHGGSGTATNVLSRQMEKVFSTRVQVSF